MILRKDAVAVIGAASAAEVGSFLVLDSVLASVAAFGSVLGLGVLHLRTRKARTAPDPPAVIPMPPSPAPPTPRRDETFIAVAELCTRIDELQRTLDSDDGIPQRLDAIRQSLHETASSFDFRATRASEENAHRAQQLTDSCKAIEERVNAVEARLLEQAKRLERAFAEGSERAGERGNEAILRLLRELARLREDVQRTGEGLSELQARQGAPVALADEHARLLASAAEHAGGLARRLGALSNGVDASLARIEASASSAGKDLEEGLRAARDQIQGLARESSTLQGASTELRRAVDESASRLARALHESTERLDGSLRALRELVEALPKPEKAPDLAPLAAAIGQAEERIADRLRALEARPPQPPTDLAPVLAALGQTKETLAARLETMQAALRPHPVELAPVIDAVAQSEERVLQRVQAAEAGLRQSEDRLRSRINVIDETVAEAIARIPALEPIDLSPLEAKLRAIEQRIEPVATPLREAEDRVHAHLAAVSEALAGAVDRIPVPEPVEVDLSPIAAQLHDVGLRIEPVAKPLRDAEDRMRAHVASLRDALTEAIARIPTPEPADLAPIEAKLHALDLAPLESKLHAIEQRIEPVAKPLREAEDRLREHVARIEEAVADAIAGIPAPDRVDLAPVEAKLRSLEQRIEPVAKPLRDTEDRMRSHAATLHAELREAIASLPTHEPLDLAPLEAKLHAIERRIEPVTKPLHEAEDRLRTHVAALHETVRDAIATIPAPERVDLAPIATKLAPLETKLDAIAHAVARIPAPAEVDLSGLHAALRHVHERIEAVRAHLDTLPSQHVDLRPVTERLEALRAAIASIPRPEMPSFDLEPAITAVRDVEERFGRRLHATAQSDRVARTEEALRLEAALGALRDAIHGIPRPDPAPPFPADVVRAIVVDEVSALAQKLHSATELLSEHALTATDAVEDLRAESEARHARVESLLTAATRRMDERLDATATKLHDALLFADREAELERRIGARVAAMEERLLEEIRAIARASHATPSATLPPASARPHRERAPRRLE